MNSSFKWGLLTGLLVSVWLIGGFSLFVALFGKTPHSTLRALTGSLGFIILFMGIFYGMKTEKAKIRSSRFTYFNAFLSGLIVTIVVAVIVSLASFLYVKYLYPGFTEDMVNEAKAFLRSSGANPQETSEKLIRVRNEFSLQAQFFAPLIVQTIAGTLFSVILAFFLKNKNPK